MYSAVVTLSIVYSQEVCETEEKVGGMGITRSGIQDKLENNLSIVGHQEGVNYRRCTSSNPADPPVTMERVRGEMISLVNDHEEFVKSLGPRVDAMQQG
jgi:hypothetical protein